MATGHKLGKMAGTLAITLFSLGNFTVAAQTPGRFMPVIGAAQPPIGHIEFCQQFPGSCTTGTAQPVVVRLTQERWRELQSVNSVANQRITPLSDQQLYGREEYWTYPTTGAGDCEEYVLEKQRVLISLGWPQSALLITVAKDLDNGGHAVLTVRTDQGDLILDNQIATIMPWYSTPYRFVKRQSSKHPANWSAISDKRITTVATIPE